MPTRTIKVICVPSRNAVPTRPPARSRVPSTRAPATWQGDIATTEAYDVSGRQRKKIEMLFARLKRILKLDRLRLRGPNGARDEFHLADTAQNLRRLAKLVPMHAPALA